MALREISFRLSETLAKNRFKMGLFYCFRILRHCIIFIFLFRCEKNLLGIKTEVLNQCIFVVGEIFIKIDLKCFYKLQLVNLFLQKRACLEGYVYCSHNLCCLISLKHI